MSLSGLGIRHRCSTNKYELRNKTEGIVAVKITKDEFDIDNMLITYINNSLTGYLRHYIKELEKPKYKFCSVCGIEIDTGSKRKYCITCGKAIKNEQNKKYYHLGK